MSTGAEQAMELVHFLGEAVRASTQEQRDRLRQEVQPLLRGQYLEIGDESEVRSAVSEIMGSDWRPQ